MVHRESFHAGEPTFRNVHLVIYPCRTFDIARFASHNTRKYASYALLKYSTWDRAFTHIYSISVCSGRCIEKYLHMFLGDSVSTELLWVWYLIIHIVSDLFIIERKRTLQGLQCKPWWISNERKRHLSRCTWFLTYRPPALRTDDDI